MLIDLHAVERLHPQAQLTRSWSEVEATDQRAASRSWYGVEAPGPQRAADPQLV
jgi:hypothetical protein